MSKFVIEGGRPLQGEIEVAANKNAILPMMAASLLTDEDCYLENVPCIADVTIMSEILQELGGQVEYVGERRLRLNCSGVTACEPSAHLVERLRASIVLLGPLLARCGRATIHHPGGDAIGTRPIGTHLDALAELGAEFVISNDFYRATLGPTNGNRTMFLDEASVTATENTMLLASATPGTMTIRNAACEPHVANLARMLIGMGADIEGAGHNVVTVRGAELHGTRETVWPDHIEVGTFAALAAASGGTVRIKNVVAEHLDMTLLTLQRMGAGIVLQEGILDVSPAHLQAIPKIRVGTWPGFPTDLSSVFTVLATQAQGMTVVHDWMYEGRMFFIDRLVQMGANIVLADPHRAVVSGPSPLRGGQHA
ncbi:MAG: UDP-N-acetylglucosamine 1-carboxyvinyltransferase, partial [Terriglobia bacterium]